MAGPIVSIGGIHLVNSSGTPVAGGAATAAATTPFAIEQGWRLMTADPIAVYGSMSLYPDIHYEPVPETIPISVIGSDHENAVALLQQLGRALLPIDGVPAVLTIQPTASSNALNFETFNGIVRPVTEDESGFECWEGFSELHAEIICMRTPQGGRSAAEGGANLINGGSVTNTGTGTPDNIIAYPAGLDGDLSHEGQPARVLFTPGASGNFTIFYLASIYQRTYSTTGSGAKTTSSTTGASAALNTPAISGALGRLGLKARVLFRFTNNTSNARVRVEMRANTGGTVLYAGPWITPTSGSATLYDMGRVPLDLFLQAADTASTIQLYIGYKSSDGASATATLGYNEFLLYYDFCRIDSPTAISTAGGASGYYLYLTDYKISTNGRSVLPLSAPIATVFDAATSTIIDTAVIRGRPPRAIEGASIYIAWMTANNVHDTTKTGTLNVDQAPLWRTLRGSD